MRVKKLISFYENQHYFTILFAHNFLSRWLNESFRFFCISYVKILKNWFILVHFTKSLFLFTFVAYSAASILALASSTLLYMSFAVALSVHQILSHDSESIATAMQEYRKQRILPYIILCGKTLYPESEIQSLLTTNYHKPIIDGKIRDDRYTWYNCL